MTLGEAEGGRRVEPAEREASDCLVEARQLVKRFGPRLILDGVSLSINRGETVAMIGPSGGGKSTFLRCLNGLNVWDSGEVRVGQHQLHPTSRKGAAGSAARQARMILGMVFQDFQLFPHLTALGNVIEAPLRVLRTPRAEAVATGMRLLERVGLADRADAWPEQLSGGQKQRVAIARAVAMGPRGLLCDEVTSALDPELKHEVLDVLEGLKQDGMALIMVTHEMGFARRAADRVVVLAEGKIVEEGPPSQVLDNPQTPRTQQFLSRNMG